MNKAILMGRLAKDPEIRYTQGATPIAIARYTLAVNRRFKKEGEPEADFISCVAFGKAAEFIEKYAKKGQRIAVAGSLSTRSYEDKEGHKKYVTEVITNEHFFADGAKEKAKDSSGFELVDGAATDDDLPF